jgi:hypothetical protein
MELNFDEFKTGGLHQKQIGTWEPCQHLLQNRETKNACVEMNVLEIANRLLSFDLTRTEDRVQCVLDSSGSRQGPVGARLIWLKIESSVY